MGEQLPWNPYGQQQDPSQGQPQNPQQQPYQPPYGQQPRQPSYTPGPQYVPQSGEPSYQGQPPYQGHSYQGQLLPYGPPGRGFPAAHLVGLAATIPILFIAWWVAYRSDWF